MFKEQIYTTLECRFFFLGGACFASIVSRSSLLEVIASSEVIVGDLCVCAFAMTREKWTT
jgi:hypothetical protein